MQNIQLIEGKINIGTKEFLNRKGISVNIIGSEDADFDKGPIITQSSSSKELQKLIFQAKEQSGLLIDNTGLDYGDNRIGCPMPEGEDMETFFNYNIIITDIPKSYTEKVKEDIQEVMNKNPSFQINYKLFCNNDNLLNKIIYDLIMLDIQSKKYNFFSANASYILE